MLALAKHCFAFATQLCFLSCASLLSTLCFASGIHIGPGATVALGNGNLDLNCLELRLDGNLNLGSGAIEGGGDVKITNVGILEAARGEILLSGNWMNQGLFVPQTSHIQISDGCDRPLSVMTGDTNFYDFSAVTKTGKVLEPESGSSQVFSKQLTLLGSAPGNRLKIRSSIPDQAAFFTLYDEAIQLIDAVDVKDNDASGGQVLAPGSPESSNSIDSGNALNWFLNLLGLEGVPATSGPVMLILALLLMFTGLFQARIHGREKTDYHGSAV